MVLQQIEWKTITDLIKNYAHFDATAENILTFLDNKPHIEEKIDKTKLFSDFLYSNDFKAFSEEIQNISSDFDATGKAEQIKKSSALSLLELNEYAKFFEIFINSHKLIIKYFNEPIIETEFNIFKREINKTFLIGFRKFVTENGEIHLEKHPLISPLFRKQVELEGTIRGKIGAIINSSEIQKKLQFSSFDLINDRYVIPIRSDAFNSKLGQIISRSDSGNTLYVEPPGVAQLNYQRLEIVVEIQAILAKVELDLTVALLPYVHDIYKISKFFLDCDEYITRVTFASKLNLSYPTLSHRKEIKLKNSFHPLIPNPVKNDISLDADHRGLIISGPNTGGKTATLKTLALTQLFLRYALFIPCDYGDVYLYDKVFYFGNDQQDLNSGLSSFSAEVQNYTSLFENLGSSNLVLVDEIFNSTSSEEASALAIAFFKKLHDITDIHLVVSSHHQTLKTILHQDENYIAAHVGFNTDDNTPTYKLHYGSPGSSHALRIFNSMTRGNNLFKDVYNTALTFLDNKVIHYEKLLESIAQKEHELSKVLQENNELNMQLKNQKQSMEGIIKIKIHDAVTRTEKKINKIMDKAEHILSQTKKGEITKHRQLDKQKVSVTSQLKELGPKQPQEETPKYENMSIPDEIIEGGEYFCMTLHKTVLIKKLEQNKKSAHIGLGNISMKVPVDSLRIANSKQANKSLAPTYISTREIKLEYDCRGMRLEEFQNLIQSITGDLMLGDVPFITIVHGHGTGVLKSWLRAHVKNSKDVTIAIDDTGNDGQTRITAS